jgi:hypothetical protein
MKLGAPLKGAVGIESKSSEDASGTEPVKKFGFDPLKSKLGSAVTPPPMKGLAAKKEGMPFTTPASTLKTKLQVLDNDLSLEDEMSESHSDDESPSSVKNSMNVEFTDIGSFFNEESFNPLSGSSNTRVKKEIGTGLPFEPKAFSPPKTRPEPQDPSIIDVAFESSTVEAPLGDALRPPKPRTTSQPGPINLWGGESFKGTVTSRAYGVGFNRPASGLDSKVADSSVPPKKQNAIADEIRSRRQDTASDSKMSDDAKLIGKDAAEPQERKPLEMELKLRLLEEKNRMLEEKLNASITIEEKKRAEEQSYSNQIAELVEHMRRLEKEVGDSAIKSERALRSREDEIKRITEVIEIKTNAQLSLETKTEKLLSEINEIRVSAERQSKKDMEALKERLIDSAKSELLQVKSAYDKQVEDIAKQLKMKVDHEKSLMEITQSQSNQLKDLKEQIDRLQNERRVDSSESREELTSGNSKDPQISVEDTMETIQNIEPLHDVVLASDSSSEQYTLGDEKESSKRYLPKYETFSQGKHSACCFV